MKVLGVCCSPRQKANTEFLLQETLNAAQEEGAEVKLVTLAGKSITPCDGCLSCDKTKRCHIEDDMLDIYAELSAADGIIFGTPIYFGTMSAQAKAVIDRSYASWVNRSLKNKVGALVVTSGGGESSNVIEAFRLYFRYQKMANGGAVVGTSRSSYEKSGEDYPKAGVKQNTKAVAEARNLGKTVVKLVESRLSVASPK